MEKSESIKNIATALVVFHGKMGKVSKDAKNPFFKSNYATLSNIQDAIETPLTESGLTYAQFPDGEDGLTTILIHAESGEYFQSTNNMKPVKHDPQALGSAITYNRRYALASILGLNIDDDDDANKATYPNGVPTKKNGTKSNDLPWLNVMDNHKNFTKEWLNVVDAINNRKITAVEQIRKHYKVSKETETKLNDALNFQPA